MTSLAGTEWLSDPELQSLLAILSVEGEEARIAGGAVRNTLLGHEVSDIDIATTTLPEETQRRAALAGFRTVPTGIEHGTITVVARARAFEVTTLRADVETDGRHATVSFGRDWQADAERRDFTINGLYATADGTVVDLVGGLADLEARRLRFIGDAEARIREDYLRILRFFRFFAAYGAGRPDADGLRAAARLKDGLTRLSAERVWSELRRLFATSDPSRALLWMRTTGVLSVVVPESEKWGIDAIHGLIEVEGRYGWAPDPILRLAAIVPPDADRLSTLADRLRLSKQDRTELLAWASASLPAPDLPEEDLRRQLYLSEKAGTRSGITRRLRLSLAAHASAGRPGEVRAVEKQLAIADGWSPPLLPVSGDDLLALGYEPGEKLGVMLRIMEKSWILSNFSIDRDGLLEQARIRLSD